MLRAFLKSYFELPQGTKKVVCLGGGVGTSQILKGLRRYDFDLTAIVSMADDGGSAGRLRRAFSVPPPGDIVNCLAALSEEESVLRELLLYRFSGKRYGKDTDLGGQKLGNLIFVALSEMYKGDANKALVEFSKIISPRGIVLPATVGDVNIWAKTSSGKKVFGEQNIDLGKYTGAKSLKSVHLEPEKPKAYDLAIRALRSADTIIAGPGDLFTTILPVLIVPEITKALKSAKARKIFIVNVANKPFETADFKVSDFIKTITAHLGQNIFDTIVVNNNLKPKIPPKINYEYVGIDKDNLKGDKKTAFIYGDLVDKSYPIYHDSDKIGTELSKLIN